MGKRIPPKSNNQRETVKITQLQFILKKIISSIYNEIPTIYNEIPINKDLTQRERYSKDKNSSQVK